MELKAMETEEIIQKWVTGGKKRKLRTELEVSGSRSKRERGACEREGRGIGKEMASSWRT